MIRLAAEPSPTDHREADGRKYQTQNATVRASGRQHLSKIAARRNAEKLRQAVSRHRDISEQHDGSEPCRPGNRGSLLPAHPNKESDESPVSVEQGGDEPGMASDVT